MRNIILLLALCLITKVSFAKNVQHPSIDEDLDFKVESDVRESDRGVAAFEEEKKSEKSQDTSKESSEDREIASDEEVFETTNENGIQYWKY